MKYVMMFILAVSFSMAMAENIPPVQEKTEVVIAQEVSKDASVAIKTVDEVKLTVKDEAFVPPEWLQSALLNVKAVPVVGPYLVTIFQWLGVFVTLMTSLFSFLWVALKSLEGVMGAAKLYGIANKLAMLQNSRFMYYLKAFSMFNAQKDEKPKV